MPDSVGRCVCPFTTSERLLKGGWGPQADPADATGVFLLKYVKVVLFKLSDGLLQGARIRFLNPDPQRILQRLVMDESIHL
ncbi:hypothetical protein BJQ97_03238 [Geobacillus sp. TFV-3]|nr:hypothetical protein BJQ97_03238 [Geobacillus sp. TFV-3]